MFRIYSRELLFRNYRTIRGQNLMPLVIYIAIFSFHYSMYGLLMDCWGVITCRGLKLINYRKNIILIQDEIYTNFLLGIWGGFLQNTPLIFTMVAVAQLVRAPDCGSGGRGFETHQPPIWLGKINGHYLFPNFACILCFQKYNTKKELPYFITLIIFVEKWSKRKI